MRDIARGNGYVAVAVALLAADALLRAALGRPYLGATVLLLVACGLSLLPFLPTCLRRPALEVAILPALAIGSFAVLLTTVSTVGIRLGDVSIRLSVLALVVVLGTAQAVLRSRTGPRERPVVEVRREALALGLLAVILAFAVASSWDIAYPFQPARTDVGHYLLYADEVAAQRQLLIDDPFSGDDRVFADPPAVGAVYGSFLLVDDISSWSLGWGLVVVSAISVLSIFVAAGGLWGLGAGLAAAAAYTVAPIRLDMMYWHGLGTSLALVFLPLVVLALGLMFRGARDGWTVGLLAVALASVAAAHSTSAIVVAGLIALAPVVDIVRLAVSGRIGVVEAARASWRDGVSRPVASGVALACLVGLGVIAHLRLQAVDLGRPVNFRFLGPDWLDRAAVAGYFSWSFLALAAIALGLVVSSSRLRRDPAVLALLALVLACVAVSQLWRVHVPFEYRRSVYYLGVALTLVIGLAFVRLRHRAIMVAAFILAVLVVGRGAVGLRLPERVLAFDRPESMAAVGLADFRQRLDSGELPDAGLVVTDACLHFGVPYFVRRPTLPAFSERQVGFEGRLPLARKAAQVLEGGAAGRALARSLDVRYVVVDPRCTSTDVAKRLEGAVVIENDELVVVQLQ